MLRGLAAAAVGVACGFPVGRAHADDLAACSDAAEKGQELRDSHRLIEARERFRECANSACPAVIQKDCIGWLEQAERSLPTVVLSAKDANGSDVTDVRVSVDGRPFVNELSGQAMPIDPGSHVFHFERGDGTTQERRAPIREGEKNQTVVVVLGTPHDGAAEAPAAASRPNEGSRQGAPWRTVGWAAGAIGLVGLAVGAVFGLMAVSDKSDAHCVGGECDAEPLASARRHATVSTIGFVAGGALLAGGTALVLFAPRADSRRATSVRLAPSLGAGAVHLEGAW
jgi:hypothetical protein